MDNAIYEYLIRNQNKEQNPSGRYQHRLSNQTYRSYDAESVQNAPVIIFQNDRAGPLEGAGDVPRSAATQHSGWIDQFLREVERASPAKQLAVGGISGWASGYVFGKVGKAAALAVGGSIIILQIANYQGLIQINWNSVQQSVEATRRRFNQQSFSNLPSLIENLQDFARRHILVTGSFFAGFLVGLAT